MIREKINGRTLIYSTKEEGNMSFKFDTPSQVLENRKRFFIEQLGLRFNRLIFLKPKGENEISLATNSLTELKLIRSPHGWYDIDADGLILSDKLKGYCVILLAADCIPVFISDKNGKYFGLIHIGRHNIEIIETLKRELEFLRLSFQDIYVHLGPCISKHSYIHSLPINQKKAEEWQPFWKYIFKDSQPNKVMIDLKGMVIEKLHNIGINSISDSNLDTGDSPSLFFSHHLAKEKLVPEGRFAALIF